MKLVLCTILCNVFISTCFANELQLFLHTEIEISCREHVFTVDIDNSGSKLLFNQDANLCVWDIKGNRLIASYRGHKERIKSACFTQDGKMIVSGGDDGFLRAWNVATGEETQLCRAKGKCVQSVSCASEKNCVLAIDSDSVLYCWDFVNNKVLKETKLDSCPECITVHQASCQLAVGCLDGSIILWDLKKWEKISALAAHTQCVRSLMFSIDAARLISGSNDRTVQSWDISSHKLLWTTASFPTSVRSVLTMYRDSVTVVGCFDGSIRIIDNDSGKEVLVDSRTKVPIRVLAKSGDGLYLAIGRCGSSQIKNSKTGSGDKLTFSTTLMRLQAK